MRKFKFFALAFAALSFAACSDDALDGKGGNTGTAGDATPAYLTISFSANNGNSSRSTADDANNNGDQDGNADDSGHYNNGTEAEQAVDRVLIVVVPANGGNSCFAKLYSTKTASSNVTETPGDLSDDMYTVINSTAGATYTNDDPIKLAIGQYNVLVVANPVVDLLTGITTGDLNAGIEDRNEVEDLYNRIVTGNYYPSEEDYTNLAAGKPFTTGTNFRVMMANKGLSTNSGQAYTVELTEENVSTEDAAEAHVEVERVLSKITFREKNNNIYTIHPKVGVVRAKTVDGAIEINNPEGEGKIWIKTKLNVAFDALDNQVYVWMQEAENGTRTYSVCKQSGTQTVGTESLDAYVPLEAKSVEEWTNDTDKSTYYAVKDKEHPMASITYQPDDSATPEQTWYVRLEGYALVNLSKNVHYVRHTITQADGEVPFGIVNHTGTYLYTPYWGEKNAVNLEDPDLALPDATLPGAEKWFYNTLADVATESKTMTIEGEGANAKFTVGNEPAAYYQPFATLGSEGGEVTGGGDKQHTDEDNLPLVGNFMAYCFENSTDYEHQVHGLSTGISFVARMYKKNENGNLSEPVQRLYRYGNSNLFESLEAIQQAFGENFLSSKFNELVTTEKSGTVITQGMLENAKNDAENRLVEDIEVYNGNICYYYTTEIKHYDNGNNSVLAPMEFAIMRNNIYSLAVTGINMVGDPAVVPTPVTPDEYPKPEEAALNVKVEILPWIVRYNDIEF